MDARLQKALEHANYRQSLGIERQRLKEKALTELVIAVNGGLFTIDRTLIAFVESIKDNVSAVLLDDNSYPVDISDLPQFLNDIKAKYFSVTNQYMADYAQIKQKRTLAKLVNL